MIVKLLSGLLATIMGFFGLGAPAQEAAPAPEQEQVAVAEQGNTDDVQALIDAAHAEACLLYTSPSPRDQRGSRMPSSA